MSACALQSQVLTGDPGSKNPELEPSARYVSCDQLDQKVEGSLCSFVHLFSQNEVKGQIIIKTLVSGVKCVTNVNWYHSYYDLECFLPPAVG
jgi:hypothetical protein